MRNHGPLLTIVAVGSLALALMGVNLGAPPAAGPSRAAASIAATPPRPPAAPTPAPTPPPAAAPTTELPDFAAEAGYGGRTAGGEATIAIAVKDGRAIAYVCDGHRIEAWLEGTATGPTLRLTGPRGATVTAELTGDAVFGQILAAGRTWPFAAQAAAAPAGAYAGSVSVRGVRKRIGWTVLPDGTVTGLVADGSSVGPAPALDPTVRSASLDGQPVLVTALRGTDDITS